MNTFIIGKDKNNIPDWIQKYIDRNIIKYTRNLGGITDCLTVKTKTSKQKHMRSLYLYDCDYIKKLSDTKLKFYCHKWDLNKNEKVIESWTINFKC